MSGIMGLYHLDERPVSRHALRDMSQCMVHRGPDGADLWLAGEVGLGHRLMRLLPEGQASAGPHCQKAEGLVVTSDVRLDNRDDLIREFGWRDRPAAAISDDALILGAYSRWGDRCPEQLLGDFAFALWDARRHRLFCARDHMGLKPFYYVHTPTSFAFASEIKALLALSWVPRHVCENSVADYLMRMHEDKESTFYEGIWRLPPAHTLTVTPAGMQLRCYWTIDPACDPYDISDMAVAEGFRERFVEAVRGCTRSTVAVGSFLSGGLDSSAVTGVARSLLARDEGRPLPTFSVVFDTLSHCDERPYIDAVVSEGGVQPHYVHGDQVQPFDELDRILWHVDEPFFATNLYLYWQLYRTAQAHHTPVVLDGVLGDSVVWHGSLYFTELAAKGHWLQLAREMHTAVGVIGSGRRGYWRLGRRYVWRPLVVEPLQRIWAGLAKPVLPVSLNRRFLNADFARRIGWMARARAFGQDTLRTPYTSHQAQLEDLRSGMWPLGFEIINKAAAAFGVTPRLPFADRRLIEYCLAVPTTQKYQAGRTRVYARRGLHDYLPEKIRQRYGKRYWDHSLQYSLLGAGREELESFVFDRLPRAAAYVNVGALQAAYRQLLSDHQRGRYHGLRARLGPLWTAVVLTRWLELEAEVGK